MFKVAILSNSPKYGSLDDQRAVIGDRDKEFILPDQFQAILGGGTRYNDVVHMAHAGAVGKFRQREVFLDVMVDKDIQVVVADGAPEIYDTPEKVAEFHTLARKRTNKGTKKQARNPGRPRKYKQPDDEQLIKLRVWWDGPQHTDDVEVLAGEMLGRKVPRVTLAEWLGKRAPHPDRVRRRRRVIKKSKETK